MYSGTSISRRHISPIRTRRYSLDGSNGAQYPPQINLDVIRCNHCQAPFATMLALVRHKRVEHKMGSLFDLNEERSALQSSLGGINQ